MYILHLDSTTKVCSVALSKDGALFNLVEIDSEKLSHSEKLHLFIQDCLKEVKLTVKDLSAVAVSKGPGSYTGLRIGVSAAKGLAYGLDIPLISVNTLDAMASAVQKTVEPDAILLPMIDARRMEVFTSIHKNSQCLKEVAAVVLDEKSFEEYAQNKVYFFGDGAAKAVDTLNSSFQFIEGIKTSAEHLIDIAWNKYQNKQFEDVAYFEPFYLKDFVAGKPKKML